MVFQLIETHCKYSGWYNCTKLKHCKRFFLIVLIVKIFHFEHWVKELITQFDFKYNLPQRQLKAQSIYTKLDTVLTDYMCVLFMNMHHW
jgi:hypothetical protein